MSGLSQAAIGGQLLDARATNKALRELSQSAGKDNVKNAARKFGEYAPEGASAQAMTPPGAEPLLGNDEEVDDDTGEIV